LLKTLQDKGVIATNDVNAIVADALGQISSITPGHAQQEAERLIQKLIQV